MKNQKIKLFSLCIVILLSIMVGCSKSSDNNNNPVDPGNQTNYEAKLTLNGSGYSNLNVTLGNGGCGFSIPDNVTGFVFFGMAGSDSLTFVFQIPGKQAGTYSWRASEPDAVILKQGTSGTTAFYADSIGTTTISNYGAVAGKVEGNISGKLINPVSNTELTISGTFSALRVPDSQ